MRFGLAVGGDNINDTDDPDDIDTDAFGYLDNNNADDAGGVHQRLITWRQRRCEQQKEKENRFRRTDEDEERRSLFEKKRKMPLLSSLPTPVLAIAPDAVRHLEGGDALSALWAVFTKCSETIQDGRRLENVSWRLWYRQLNAAALATATITSGTGKGGDERLEYVTADEKFVKDDDEWDEKIGLLDVVEEVGVVSAETDRTDTKALEDTISTEGIKTGLESTSASEKERQEHQRYPSAQLDTTLRVSHDQGVARTTFTALSATFSSTGTATTTTSSTKSASTIAAIATTTTTTTTATTSPLSPRIINSSSAPSPTSLVPRPSLRHTSSSPHEGQRRKSFLAVVGPGGRMNVGQIICDLISATPSSSPSTTNITTTLPQGDFGGFESITTRRRMSVKMKRWHSESTIVGDEQPEQDSVRLAQAPEGHEVVSERALVGGPRTSRGTPSGSILPTEGSLTASTLPSTPTTPTTKRGAPSTMLTIPTDSSSSSITHLGGTPGAEQQRQQHHHQHHCVSQLPTPGAETDDAGNGMGVDGIFGSLVTAEQGSTRNTTTTTTTVCSMVTDAQSGTTTLPVPPAVISVDDLSIPRTPPDSDSGVVVVSGRGAATASPSTPRGPVPPTLVIVNPTPGPTPQPTPPSTPLLEGGPTISSSKEKSVGGKHGAFLGVPSTGSRRGMKRNVGGGFVKVTKDPKEVVKKEAEDTAEEWEEDDQQEESREGMQPRAGPLPKLDVVTSKTTNEPNPGRISPSESTRSDDSGLGSSIVSLPLDQGNIEEDKPKHEPPPVQEPPSPTPSQQQYQQGGASTSVTSTVSAKSTRSAKAVVSAAAVPSLAMTRRASTGVVAGRSKARGATKARVNLGGRSKSTASLGGGRSRSRGREDSAVVGLAAAAVGVMTTALTSSPGTIGQEEEVVKKRRSSSGDVKSRRRVSGFAALTRTLSHEDVLEVTEDDDDDHHEDAFEDESTDEEDGDPLKQEKLAAQLRQEEDRLKREQLLLRTKQLQEEERQRVAEYERQAAEVQAEKETEEGLRNMMIIQQQQQHLLQQQQHQDMYQRQQYEAKLALQRQRQDERERMELEERIRVQQAALRAAEAEARAQAQAEARAAAAAAEQRARQAEAEARTRERLRASAGMGVTQPKGAVARTKATMFEFGSNSDDGSVSVVSAGVVSKGSDGSSERGSSKGKEREVAQERQLSSQQLVAQQQLAKPMDSKAARKSVPADQIQLAAALQAAAEMAERQDEQEATSSKGKNKSKDVGSNSKTQPKGKGKQRDKSTTSTSSGVAGAGVMTSLASPLLPSNTNKRTIVLATSESEYTDTDDDEGDSWTSEEEEGDDDSESRKPASVRSQPPQQQQTSHARRPSHPDPSQARAGPAPAPRPGLLRTQSTTSGHQRFMTKREQVYHARRQVELAAIQLRREEEEKQRHKEMFAKKPTSSFQNVAKLGMTTPDGSGADKQGQKGEEAAPPRTKSALSLLLNPDPRMFPENHPYRRGYSSGELVRPGPSHMMGLGGMGAFGPMTNINPPGAQQQRPQANPVQLGGGHDARMDQARVPQRRPAGLDRQMSDVFLAHDAQQAEKRKQAEQQHAAKVEEDRVRRLHDQKVEEEERTRRARIQQVDEEERVKQKQLQQALYERAQREQREQQPQRRVTDPPAAPAAPSQLQQEQQRSQHRRQASQQSRASRPPSMHQQGGVGSMMPLAFRGAGMQVNKGSAAMPVASQVDIGPIAAFERPPGATTTTTNNSAQRNSTGGVAGHRPRGPPQGQELETDSEDEAGDKENVNALNMAKSIAEQKLRTFAEKRGIVPAPLSPAPAAAPPSPLGPHPGPSRLGCSQRELPMETTPPWARQPHHAQRHEEHRSYGKPLVTPQPIPLAHPYNLPVAAIPTTPRTTRKLMLRTELSESVRRGLLWERQQGVKPIKRTASASNAEGARFPPIPQLAASPSMVQLRPKVRRLEGLEEVGPPDPPSKKATPEELEERRKKALARNRSDANNFHTSGW